MRYPSFIFFCFFIFVLFLLPKPLQALPKEVRNILVKKVRFEGNLILDDVELAKVLNMGIGMKLTPNLLTLLTDEVQGFYSSHGFHRVRADIPLNKSAKGVLTMRVYETSEIQRGKSDTKRAEMAIERLISRNKLKLEKISREKVITTLVKAYERKRTDDFGIKKKRLKAEAVLAKIQRDNYLDVLEENRKLEDADLKMRRNTLLSFFSSQKKLVGKQKEEEIKRLMEMRQKMRKILAIKFNGS